MTVVGPRPDVIGTYKVESTVSFYAARYDELDRGAIGIARLLRSFKFAPGSAILVVSLVQEVLQIAPFERAVQVLGMYGVNAELSPFDAGRVESSTRQFLPVAIFGVGASTLEGLKSFGHDPAKIFADRTIWARPDAYDAVAAMPYVDARRVVFLGPTTAIECAHGGLHYDSRDWFLESRGGRLHLSSRMPRFEPLSGLDTGVDGAVSTEPCACGTKEAVIILGGVQ